MKWLSAGKPNHVVRNIIPQVSSIRDMRKEDGYIERQVKVPANVTYPQGIIKKQIVTHANPDLDAIVSAWIAQDFLFKEHESEVLFVSRKVPEKLMLHADCVVDVGNTYIPENYRFDHKPPAFQNRNSTCATRLIWEYLRDTGANVAHLEPLVQITYQGDTHRNSDALKQSRIDGPHAELVKLKSEYKEITEVYRQMVLWLRSYTEKL